MSDYIPIIKKVGFRPNPIKYEGIPGYADSKRNPNVKGTQAWKSWWDEQFDRCLNGYTTGGVFIPGRYYYYLNFCYMTTVGKGTHLPDYVDIDLEFFRLVEVAKKENKGIICIKARRKGLSYKVSGGIFDYGLRFGDRYEAGICAGLDEHSKDFFNKLKRINADKPNELKLNLLKDNDHTLETGYKKKVSTGYELAGAGNKIYCETMFDNPNKFKGKKLEDCVFEESGEFPLLSRAYEATKPCFMDGDKMVGTCYIYGTGGNLSTSSKDFANMWHNNDQFNLLKFEVMGDRMYFPCVEGHRDSDGVLDEDIPYLKKVYEPEMRVGMEDPKRAKELILDAREKLKDAENRQDYYDHLQNYPLNIKEAFLKFSGNHFDADSINDQMFAIESSDTRKWGKYKLEFVRETIANEKTGEKKDRIKRPLEVKAEPLPENYKGDEYVMIWKHPVPNYRNMDCAGVDSYDVDQSNVSKSLGAMVVFRRKNAVADQPNNAPVAMIRCRPKRKETFYNMCLMLSVYYNLKRSVLIDAEKPAIISHFEHNGGERYLAYRPAAFDSPNSKQIHKYGVKMTISTKPTMLSMMQSWVLDYLDTCWFSEILEDLLYYDVTQKDSDWDSADALGFALIQDNMIGRLPTHYEQDSLDSRYELPHYVEDEDGNLVPVFEGEDKGSKQLFDPNF